MEDLCDGRSGEGDAQCLIFLQRIIVQLRARRYRSEMLIESCSQKIAVVDERKFFSGAKVVTHEFSTAPPFHNGEMKKQGKNGGT